MILVTEIAEVGHLEMTVVTDAEGVIRFADLTDNYRLRPEPSTYLQLLTEKVQS